MLWKLNWNEWNQYNSHILVKFTQVVFPLILHNQPRSASTTLCCHHLGCLQKWSADMHTSTGKFSFLLWVPTTMLRHVKWKGYLISAPSKRCPRSRACCHSAFSHSPQRDMEITLQIETQNIREELQFQLGQNQPL